MHTNGPCLAQVKGGVEFGFMSTTMDKQVALSYASADNRGTVLEIQMGMIDRGADLTWVSQYPHEKEILFSPLTGLETISSRVEGQVLIVEMRLSVNLTMPTIDEVVAKMRKANIGLLVSAACPMCSGAHLHLHFTSRQRDVRLHAHRALTLLESSV